ncbi:class I SAM-dependent methyltransferase [Hanstruepera ponticola]|uniref:class I SAM-dependent methyltransferase n=1 Tax=Hanstruepera ponticola TaxID=2042995 RepID=UPI00177B9FE4|nr:class I SAM-dependent methyltransferase [Hanstruepera ponticola]
MLESFKQLVPLSLKRRYWRFLKNRARAQKKRIRFDGKTAKDTFTYIYNTNYWNGEESISGGGSDLVHTKVVVEEIGALIKQMNIHSVLDIPCGDFAWMQYANLHGASYIGGDIVDDLIVTNTKAFSHNPALQFKVLDLTSDPLPKSDILINRDCLVHLSNHDIFKALQNIKNSGCTYLLTTTFPEHTVNTDISTGHWRALNLEKPPFNFCQPLHLISEQYNNPKYSDKSLGLWRVDDLNLFE